MEEKEQKNESERMCEILTNCAHFNTLCVWVSVSVGLAGCVGPCLLNTAAESLPS